jgi:hypothetical protein
MNQINTIANTGKAEFVSPQSRHAWKLWKKLNDFSGYLWDVYEYDFLTLAASEPPLKGYPRDDLPF